MVVKWNKTSLTSLITDIRFLWLSLHPCHPYGFTCLSHSFTVSTALSLAPTIPLLPGFVQLPYHLSTPLGCLFLIWADKHSRGKSPSSAVRVHHVFVLSKSDLGPQGLFQILYSFFMVSSHFPWGLGQTYSSAHGVPDPVPLLLTFNKSYSTLCIGRRTKIIFLGSPLSTQTSFCFHCKHFFIVSGACGPFFLPRLILHYALDPVPQRLVWYPASSVIFFLSLSQLLSSCLLPHA